jgi:hypothetical protein
VDVQILANLIHESFEAPHPAGYIQSMDGRTNCEPCISFRFIDEGDEVFSMFEGFRRNRTNVGIDAKEFDIRSLNYGGERLASLFPHNTCVAFALAQDRPA